MPHLQRVHREHRVARGDQCRHPRASVGLDPDLHLRVTVGGKEPADGRRLYKHRNVVERAFNRLKQWRGMATRYGKTAESCRAAVMLAALLLWA